MIFEVASLTNDYDSASQRWLTDTDCPITVTMVVATDTDWKIVINSWKCSHFPIFPSSMRILDGCNNHLLVVGWRSTLKANLRTEVDLAAGRTSHLEIRVLQCWRRLMCSQVCDVGLGERVKIIHLGWDHWPCPPLEWVSASVTFKRNWHLTDRQSCLLIIW